MPSTSASLSQPRRRSSCRKIASSDSASAAVEKPSERSSGTPSAAQARSLPMRVHGTWNTVPIDTRAARRYSGSWHDGVTSTASMPSAAAERNTAPMFV